MAELATIARPYAEALFKACRADLAATAVWLDELAAIAANDQLLQFAHGPKVTAQQTFDVVTGVAKTALPEKAKNFLRVLIDNSRLNALPEIKTLELRFKRKLNVQVEIEPALIGGVRVVVGDEVLDTSVKARLEQMKVALIA